MTLQMLDTTTGAGDNLQAGGNKLNASMADLATRIPRTFERNVASRGISGKMIVKALSDTSLTPANANASTTGATFQVTAALPGAYEEVQILIPNIATTPVTGVKCSVACPTASGGFQSTKPAKDGSIGQATGANPGDMPTGRVFSPWSVGSAAYGWSKLFFNNFRVTEIDLPASPDGIVASWVASDWTPLNSVPRTDGGTLPLLAVRVQYPAAGTAPLSGAASSSPGVTLTDSGFANWGIDGALDGARNFNGGHLWKAFADLGLGVDNNLNFQGSNNPVTVARSVPIIIRARLGVEVHTFMFCEDSMGEYITDGETGNSSAFRGMLAAQLQTGKLCSWLPITVPSGDLFRYGRQAHQVIDMIKPTVLWIKPIGPNETTGTLTQDTTDRFKSNLAYSLSLGQKYGSKVIIRPHLAVMNAGAYSWNASASFWAAGNAYLAAQASNRNYLFFDTNAPWTSGGTIVSGQQQPAAANTIDGVHPSEAGSVAMTATDTASAVAAINLL